MNDNREIEFHDLIDYCKSNLFNGGELSSASCEQIATRICSGLAEIYEGRKIMVSVFEDNENGSVVELGIEE